MDKDKKRMFIIFACFLVVAVVSNVLGALKHISGSNSFLYSAPIYILVFVGAAIVFKITK